MRGLSKASIYALAVMCCVFWAGAYVTGKTAIGTPDAPQFGPFKAAFFRFATAGVLLAAWGLWRAPASLRVRRADWPAFGRLALLGMCLTYTFNYTGLKLTTGTAAALIMATEPVWVALLAVFFLRERMTPARGAGVFLGLAGALLVVLSSQRPEEAGTTAARAALLGNLLLVISLFWEACAVLTVKRLTERYGGRTIVTYEFLLGSLLLAPFALWERIEYGPISPDASAWWAFLYLLGPCTLIGYTVWFRLLEVTDASELMVFIFLQPVIGTLLGVFWLGDPFTAATGLGALLVLGGVACITRSGIKTGEPESLPEIARAASE